MNNAYLITSTNVVGSGRAWELGFTEEEWNKLPEEVQNEHIKEAAWSTSEVYPEYDKDEENVKLVVCVGLVGCDIHVETDFQSIEEWEALDVNDQNYYVNDAFWQAVEAYVVFEPNLNEADKHTGWNR